mmetsp:Transcript_1174/g.3625  ORF Transcript_1174/g.3625 Transcript_1174/m.3625 type:complete len:197 (-) Transcript_1174:74-664(-)
MVHARRPLLALALAAAATVLALRSASDAFVSAAVRPASRTVGARLPLRALDEDARPTLPSNLDDKTPAELMEIKAKAADLWDSMKGDIKDLLAQYNTFRPDKFEEFMRQDTRGIELFKLYKPGTPEYAEFFEEEMGPYLLELAKEKLGEGLGQAGGVVLIVGGLVAFLGFFGTDIVQGITAPFTGFANEFVQLYGF